MEKSAKLGWSGLRMLHTLEKQLWRSGASKLGWKHRGAKENNQRAGLAILRMVVGRVSSSDESPQQASGGPGDQLRDGLISRRSDAEKSGNSLTLTPKWGAARHRAGRGHRSTRGAGSSASTSVTRAGCLAAPWAATFCAAL